MSNFCVWNDSITHYQIKFDWHFLTLIGIIVEFLSHFIINKEQVYFISFKKIFREPSYFIKKRFSTIWSFGEFILGKQDFAIAYVLVFPSPLSLCLNLCLCLINTYV